jgi:dihydrofolate reductase
LGEQLHSWYFSGQKSNSHSDFFKPGEGSEEVVEQMMMANGAAVVGRNFYDITQGWGGNHPVHGLHCFVVTHRLPGNVPRGETKFTFVTDGVESAVRQARASAGNKPVGVAGANVAQQALNAGVVDELMIHLVPLLLGNGVRLFDHLAAMQLKLEVLEVIQAKRCDASALSHSPIARRPENLTEEIEEGDLARIINCERRSAHGNLDIEKASRRRNHCMERSRVRSGIVEGRAD